MTFRTQAAILTIAMLATGWLAGCRSLLTSDAPPSQFYVLGTMSATETPTTPQDPALAMGIYNANMPEYLDMPQMVSRPKNGEGNQVDMDEYHRWSGPLGADISLALAQDLTLLSGSKRVGLFPQARLDSPDFEVYSQIYQFDGVLDGQVTLRVQWRVTGHEGQPTYYAHESVFTRAVGANSNLYAGYVEALSGLVGDYAKEIMAALPLARAEAQKAADAEAARKSAENPPPPVAAPAQ